MINDLRVLVIVALAVAGCFTPAPKDGALTCNPSGKACPDGYACQADNHCWSNGHQPNGVINGDACTDSSGCIFGHCVDGVCCDSACTDTCSACDVPGAAGTCSPIAAGEMPHGARGSCPDNFACGASGCNTSCNADADCQANFKCTGGSCVRPAESDCLDGIDNNGDGLADCADPTCTSQVECVETTGSDPIGTLSVASCADPYGSGTVEHQSFTAGTCSAGSCGCTANVVCSGTGTLYSASNACGGASVSFNFNSSGGCVPFTTGTYQSGVFAYTGVQSQSCTNNGAAAMSPSTWGTTTNFCAVTKKSNTCDSTHVCVAKVATPICVQLAGAAQTCPSGYTTTSGTYYSGYADGSCSCGCTVTGNNCSRNNVETQMYADLMCQSFYGYASICSRPCCNSLYFGGAKAFNGSPLGSMNAYDSGTGTCSSSFAQVTAPAPTGPSTICCK